MDALTAVASLARGHGLPVDDLVVLKDGSNLLVRIAPVPVVVRVATFTAFIRIDPLPWLQCEVALGTHLAASGASVVGPSPELPPGPHSVGEWWLTAWQYVPHDPSAIADPLRVLAALDDLRPVLATFGGLLPVYGPVSTDLDAALECCVRCSLLSAEEVAALRTQRDELLSAVAHLPRQAQHGDAHPRNVLVTPGGLVWNDLEDCCSASPLWDLATLARRDPSGAVWSVARDRFGVEAAEAMVALRDIQARVWTLLHAARPLPGFYVEAAEREPGGLGSGA
jgi:hypothetical protein